MADFDDRIRRSDMERERDRERRRDPQWTSHEESGDPRSSWTPEGEGFSRRGGWREGSDYYGDRQERYQPRGEDERGGWRDSPSGYGRTIDYAREGQRWRDAPQSFSRRGEQKDYPFDADQWREDRERYGAWGSLAGALGLGHRGRGPKGYRRSDERIREDACERLTDDHRVDATNIDITVQDGEVTLSGSVNSRMEKRRAEDLMDDLSGVRDVHNRLRVVNESGVIESGEGDAQRGKARRS